MRLDIYPATALLLASLAFPSASWAQGGDTCATPTDLPGLGSYAFDTTAATTSAFAGQSACPGNVSDINQDLFWTFTVPANGHYLFNTVGSTFDTVIKVYDGDSCAAPCLAANDNWSFLQSEVRLYGLSIGQRLLIQVGGYMSPFSGQPDEFGAGTLTIERTPDPCAGSIVADFLENSDRCDAAAPIGDGLYTSLSLSSVDSDFYELEVAPGATVDLNVEVFVSIDAAILLWDTESRCTASNQNLAVGSAVISPSSTGSFDTDLSYTNPGTSPVELILELRLLSMQSCSTYELMVSGSSGALTSLPISSPYCETTINSSGEPATLWVVGSPLLADANASLVAASLPTQAFGIFLASRSAGFTANPASSAGNLCLGGAIGRYVGPGQVQSSGLAGAMELQLDLAAIPQPNGAFSVVPGDRLYFQLWVRDSAAGVPTSNFSNGANVRFL